MGNVFPTDTRLHRKYDLKGSTYGRTVGAAAALDSNAVLKDLDLDVRLEVAPAARAALLEQVARDTQLLEKLHIMDYSLLLGLHFPTWGNSNWVPPNSSLPEKEGSGLELISPALTGRQPVRHAYTATRDVYATLRPRSSNQSGGRSSFSCARLAQPFPGTCDTPAEKLMAGGRGSAEWDSSMDKLIRLAVNDGGTHGAVGRPLQWSPPESKAPPGPPSPFSLEEAQDPRGSSQAQNGKAVIANGPLEARARDGQGSGLRSLRRLVTPVPVRRLGEGMPGCALPKQDGSDASEPAILYFGIIDFLQEYNLRKRTEHILKSIVIDGSKVSVTSPAKYARRFHRLVSDLFVTRYNSAA
eukprot:jgi/Botrbrau1/13229/Bobra.0199s0002.1